MDDKKQIIIALDENGNKVVVIPIIEFTGRRKINWKAVEKSLRKYVGMLVETADTKDVIYIGRDFPDEFANSVYTKNLKGGLAKAKANLAAGIPELIETAKEKRWSENFKDKHKRNAMKGWYRYNVRFALPKIDNQGNILGLNTYQAVLIVRHASDDRLYLYDVQNIRKKETSKPL